MKYVPKLPIPNDPQQLQSWLIENLRAIGKALGEPEPDVLRMRVLYAAPEKIEDGNVVVADGTSWNPGAGAGAYLRIGGAWVKL